MSAGIRIREGISVRLDDAGTRWRERPFAFDRDPQLIRRRAAGFAEIPELPSITADFRRRARDSYWPLSQCRDWAPALPLLSDSPQPFDHREGIGWLLKLRASGAGRRRRSRCWRRLREEVRALPLPLTRRLSDSHAFAIRVDAPAGDYLLESFAEHARLTRCCCEGASA